MRGGWGWRLGVCSLLAAASGCNANPGPNPAASPAAAAVASATPAATVSPPARASAAARIVEGSIRETRTGPRATVDISYPQFQGLADERVQLAVNEQLNADAKKAASDWFVEVKTEPSEPVAGTDPNEPLNTNSLDERFEQAMLGPRIASLRVFKTFYHAGAAHPVTTIETYNIDLEKGRFYELRDVFTPGSDYLGFLSDISRKLLEVQKVGDEQQRIDGTSPKAENFAAWVVVPDGIEITFGPYQVASYAEGLPRILILRQAIGQLTGENGPLGYSSE